MEKKGLDYYRQRRLEKHKQRQKRQIKQMGLIIGLFLFGTVTAIALMSKPSTARVENATAVKNVEHSKTKEHIVMASSGKVKLLLPIPSSKLTTLGYHEAFNPQALSLKPSGRRVNAKKLKTKAQLDRLKKRMDDLIYSLMWRGARSGPLNSAVDVGSKAGTLNYSPLSGKVVKIRNYNLYGRIPDKEIHILPDKAPDRHLVIIHMNDIKVKVGDRVTAGVTPIGRTRRLSTFIRQQLSDYSKDAGDHVHYQVNKLVNGVCHVET